MYQTIIARHKDGSDEFCLGIVVESLPGHEDEDPVEALRAAAADFCRTDEGRAAIREASGNYNWGDLVGSISDEACAAHGVRVMDTFTTDLIVDHNESLLPEE